MADDAEFDLALRAFGRSARGAKVRAAVSQACPNDEALVAWREAEQIDAEKALVIAQHVLGCPQCVRRLSPAGAVGKLTSHPSAALLLCHAEKRLPAGSVGHALEIQIKSHLASCPGCREQALALGASVSEGTHGPAVSKGSGTMNKLLVRSLAAMARMQEAANDWARSMQPAMAPAYRRGSGESIAALILDPKGKVSFDSEGRVVPAEFALAKAVALPERGLTVDLITRDQRLVGRGVPALVEVTLMTAESSLRLPPQPLKTARDTPYPAARVSFRHRFAVPMEMAIPARALCVTVTCPDQPVKEKP